jgi:NAD(P)H dehydrogenase (quinone)
MKPTKLAITGASGQLGSRVAVSIARLGLSQRLIVRNPDRALHLPGVEIAQVSSYGDETGMRRALAGIDRLFLVSARDRFGVAHISAMNHVPPPSYDRLLQHRAAIDAAVDAGVQYIIYLSIINAAPDAAFILAHDHYHTEEYIRTKNILFTFLRAGLYTDNVSQCVSANDVIRVPAGKGRAAWVTRDDIANAAVSVLTGTGHEGRTYDLTGPEALTMAETAECISTVIGRRITYQEQTPEEARSLRTTSRLEKFEAERKMLTGHGLDDYEVEVFVTHFLQIATGALSKVSQAVPDLTGRPAQSVAEYLHMHPENYRHLLRSWGANGSESQ